jgi:general secretion pathway protein G
MIVRAFVRFLKSAGSFSPVGLRPRFRLVIMRRSQSGFTLLELVITITVLSVLTLGVVPLVKLSVRRQREQRLRETLREMRLAIDQFHREALAGAQMQPGQSPVQAPVQVPVQPNPGQPPGANPVGPGRAPDPRVRVAITDNTIWTPDNVDRYPPDLETLVKGVSVTPLAQQITGGLNGPNATDNQLTSTKKKIYLREIPIDPITGKADWVLRSSYDAKDAPSWGGENVFDVRSNSNGTALNGEKYSDW